MLSSIPGVLIVLTVTATIAALRLAVTAFRGRQTPPVTPPDPVLARLNELVGLAWAIFFLVHFVFLAALAESREVGERLSVIGSLAGGLALLGALGSLVAALRGQR